MKKTFGVMMAAGVLAVATVFTGCGRGEEVYVIGERFFLQQMDNIFLNHTDYLGRTLQYQGLFRTVHWPPTNSYHHYVFRYVASCCGMQGMGFEVLLGNAQTLPDESWVEVTGVLEEYQGYIVIRVVSLVEIPRRGTGVIRL